VDRQQEKVRRYWRNIIIFTVVVMVAIVLIVA
jgi:hypothetical protein